MQIKKVQVPGRTGPSGSIIIWLAALVFGVSAGLLLVYHFLMASRSVSTRPIEVAEAAPVAPKRPTLAKAAAVSSAHSAAMKEALKSEGP
ncbi:MAG: hypothetical protein Q7J32_17470 [Sphingomonadaceae bacterium]|nr:hypothetical protein [Sphingomonadaceae bacterium]